MRQHRAHRLLVILGLLLAGVLASSALAAQEGQPADEEAPASGGFEIAPGVTAEALAFIEGQEAPSVYILTFEPGVTYALHASPALEVGYIETGLLVIQASAPMTVGDVNATDAAAEVVEAGSSVTVETGQYVVLTPGTDGEIRNEGEDPAIVRVAGLVPGGMAAPEASPAS